VLLTVERALWTVVDDFARDPEREYRRRFDAAVARYPRRMDADTTRFDILRALLYAVEDEAPT
jgi:hypothetical protein